MRIGLAASAALGTLLLAGCGGNSTPQATGDTSAHVAGGSASPSASSSATVGPSSGDLTKFFSAISSQNPRKLKAVIGLAAPGSIAAAYIDEQYAVMLAGEQADNSFDAETFSKNGSGYKSCGSDNSCVTWDNIEARGDKIATFTVNGKQLSNRLSVGGGKPVAVGSLGTVTIGEAYQGVQSGALFVTFKLKAGSLPLMVDQTESAYVGRNGTQVSAAEVVGPSTLLPNAVGNYYIDFPHSAIGGKLTLNVIDQKNYNNAMVTVPTR